MTSPFRFDVAALLRPGALPEHLVHTGPSPLRIGPAMIAIPEGGEVTVDTNLRPLGDAVLAEAAVSARMKGKCSRCLKELNPMYTLDISTVFAADEDFIQGEEDEDEEVPMVEENHIDLTQATIDEAGLNLPFNPVCADFGEECDEEAVPAPDGVSGEEERVDPRWAGLEKFL